MFWPSPRIIRILSMNCSEGARGALRFLFLERKTGSSKKNKVNQCLPVQGSLDYPFGGNQTWCIYKCMIILRDFPKNSGMEFGLVSFFMTPRQYGCWLSTKVMASLKVWLFDLRISIGFLPLQVVMLLDRGIDPWAHNDTLDKIRSTTCGFYDINCFARTFPIKPFGMSLPERASSCFCSGLPGCTFPSPGFSWDRQFQRVSTNAGQYSQTRPDIALQMGGVCQLLGGTPRKTNKCHLKKTFPETNIEPENGWFGYLAILLRWPIIQGRTVSFRDECSGWKTILSFLKRTLFYGTFANFRGSQVLIQCRRWGQCS